MIVDQLARSDRYAALHPGLAAGLQWLKKTDLASLDTGKHAIDGDRLLVIIGRDPGRGREASLLEYHRRYIDIQYVIAGEDLIGWLDLEECRREKSPYDSGPDIGFYYDRPETWLRLPAGWLAILFPSDAHAPLANTAPLIHKAVVKVAVAW